MRVLNLHYIRVHDNITLLMGRIGITSGGVCISVFVLLVKGLN